MAKLPAITGSDAIKAFSRAGFSLERIASSHHILKKSQHPFLLTVPVHGNKTLKAGLLRSLIRASGLTVDQFLELLSKP